MTDTLSDSGSVVQLRAAEVSDEQHLERAQPPAYVDTTDRTNLRRPIIPEPLRRANLRGTVRHHAGRHWHATRFHAVRSPLYLAVTLWHATRGFARLTARLMSWWHWSTGWQLESQAVAAGRAGHHEAMRAHTEGKKTRAARSRIVAACALLSAVALAAVLVLTPWWAWALLGAVLVLVLARHGRTDGRTVVKTAVVPPQFEKLTTDIIVRALGSLGLTGINQVLRDGKEIIFVTPVTRDGPGYRVALDLPFGVTAAEVIERRDKLASGLRRPLGCVWPEAAEDHAGRLVLYVCDEPLNKAHQPAWPLARAGKADIFAPIPFGTDQRGKVVSLVLMFANLLIGSIPRMGKTVAMRLVLLAAALDPITEIHTWELKGTGDLDALARVAHSYGSGADDETIEACLADLRKVHAELDRRAKVIKGLPKEACPESKVTPQLSARKSLRLHPVVFGIDECQEAFSHPEFGAEFERLCLPLIRRGPALGIMLVLATQRPDSKSLPTAITANVAMRFCLKVMDQIANDLVLGTSAYRRGLNATLLGFGDKGIGWGVGLGPAPQVLKTYSINGTAAERIAQRALEARQLAGTLTGYAAGHDDAEPPRDFLADVLSVFDGDRNLYSTSIAERLADRLPAVYADLSASAVSAQLRALGVTVKKVREPGQPAGWGAERTAIEAVTT